MSYEKFLPKYREYLKSKALRRGLDLQGVCIAYNDEVEEKVYDLLNYFDSTVYDKIYKSLPKISKDILEDFYKEGKLNTYTKPKYVNILNKFWAENQREKDRRLNADSLYNFVDDAKYADKLYRAGYKTKSDLLLDVKKYGVKSVLNRRNIGEVIFTQAVLPILQSEGIDIDLTKRRQVIRVELALRLLRDNKELIKAKDFDEKTLRDILEIYEVQ